MLQTPQPLSQKQKVRQAWLWIVEASDKRQSTEKVFGKRLAQEVMSVLNGQSEALKKLVARHEQAVTGRAKYVERFHRVSLELHETDSQHSSHTVLDDKEGMGMDSVFRRAELFLRNICNSYTCPQQTVSVWH